MLVQPLLAKHCEEHGEERNGGTCIRRSLGPVGYSAWGTGPLRDCRNVVAERDAVHLVDEDAWRTTAVSSFESNWSRDPRKIRKG